MVKIIKSAMIISNHPYPGNMATANRINFFVDAMKKLKVKEIKVIAQKPKNKKEIKNFISTGIKLIHIDSNINKSRNIFIRFIQEIYFILRIQLIIMNNKTDISIYTIPSILLILNIILNKKNKLIVDFRDIVWEYLNTQSIFNRIIKNLIRKLTKYSISNSDLVTVTNIQEASYIKKIHNKRNCLIIKNGISIDKFNQISKRCMFKKKKPDNLTITYIGNIGIAQKLENLINFAKSNTKINLRIGGDGVELDHLKKLSKGYKNITFLGYLKWVDVIKEYNKSDVLYAQITDNFKSAIPSKPFEYIIAKRPIILGLPAGPAKKLYSKFDNLYICKPNNEVSIGKALHKVKRLSLKSYKKNKKIIKSNFIREDNLATFIKSVEEV